MRSAARRGVLVPAIAAFAVFAVLISLGIWQVERLAWKEALLDELTRKLAAPPVALPPPAEWPRLDRETYEYRRVVFRAEYLPGKAGEKGADGRVWSVGSALRDDIKAPGIFVFAPARLAGGDIVVVNRGFVAEPKPTWRTPVPPPSAGSVEITGIMRWPETPGWFPIAAHDATQDVWFLRDHLAMAAVNRWGAAAPFYIERERQTPPDGLPPVGSLKPNLPNNHLGYALTWFGLALVLVGVFAAWLASRRRQSADGTPGPVAD